MPYAKLDLLVDTETLCIYDFVLRTKPRHDVIAATSIFRRTKLRGVLFLGDKGYDNEPLHAVAAEKQNLLFAPVRKSPRKRPQGFYRRCCAKGCAAYPRRNTVESVNHSLKTRRLPTLRSKLHFMKKRETAWQVLIYNMERLRKSIKAHIRALLRIILDTPKKRLWGK
jgi:hypothetical protein